MDGMDVLGPQTVSQMAERWPRFREGVSAESRYVPFVKQSDGEYRALVLVGVVTPDPVVWGSEATSVLQGNCPECPEKSYRSHLGMRVYITPADLERNSTPTAMYHLVKTRLQMAELAFRHRLQDAGLFADYPAEA